MCLSELGRDSEAIVKNLSGDQRFISRITSIGLTPGCNLKLTVRIALYYTASALILSTIVYHIGLLIW